MSGFNTRLVQSVQLRQEMKINPRLYQAMELLYMPLLDLQQHLKQELAENLTKSQHEILELRQRLGAESEIVGSSPLMEKVKQERKEVLMETSM